jgi:hypothetical protein
MSREEDEDDDIPSLSEQAQEMARLRQQLERINEEALASIHFLAKLGYPAKPTDPLDAGLISGLLGTLARIRDIITPQ